MGRLRRYKLGQQAGVADGNCRLRLVDDRAQFTRAQKRHGRHRHQTRAHHGQPGQRHADAVATAQQHPVAGNEPEVFRQVVRNAAYPLAHFCIAEGHPWRPEQRAVGESPGVGLVQQHLHQIQLRRELQLGQLVARERPLFTRREAFVHESVDLSAGGCRDSRFGLAHRFTPAKRLCR